MYQRVKEDQAKMQGADASLTWHESWHQNGTHLLVFCKPAVAVAVLFWQVCSSKSLLHRILHVTHVQRVIRMSGTLQTQDQHEWNDHDSDFALANSDFPTCAVHLRNMPKFVKQELVGPKAQYLIYVSIYAHVFADVYWIFDDICLSCLSGARTYHSSRDCSMTFSRDWKFLGRAIQSWRSKSMLCLLRLTQEPCLGCGVAGSYHEVLRW